MFIDHSPVILGDLDVRVLNLKASLVSLSVICGDIALSNTFPIQQTNKKQIVCCRQERKKEGVFTGNCISKGLTSCQSFFIVLLPFGVDGYD